MSDRGLARDSPGYWSVSDYPEKEIEVRGSSMYHDTQGHSFDSSKGILFFSFPFASLSVD